MKLDQIVGTDEKHEIVFRPGFFQGAYCFGGIAGAVIPLEVRDADAGIIGAGLGGREAGLVGRHALIRFQRVLRRYQPPNLVQIETVQGGQADIQMAPVGRIERAAEKTDAFVIAHRVWPVPRTTYLNVVS